MPISDRIDNLIGVVSPRLALQRVMDRQRMKYFRAEGATSNRGRKTIARLENPESSTASRDRVSLMKEARDLEQNFGMVRGVIQKLAMYVCGSIKYQSRTGDREIDKQYEQYFENWSNNCDSTGRFNLQQMAYVAVMSTFRDGDCGFIIVNDDDGIKLLALEADRIGDPNGSIVTQNQFSGITIDNNGRPIKYQPYNLSPNGVYSPMVNSKGEPLFVDANNFIHFFMPMKFSGYRGVSHLEASITTLRDIKDLLEYERMAAKFAGSQTGIVKTNSGSAPDISFDTTSTDKNDNTLSLESIQPGTISYLSPDEDIKMFESNRPSVSFNGFIQTLVRDALSAPALPYGFFWDMAALGGAAARYESSQAKRTVGNWQSNLQVRFLNRIKNLILLDGISKKEIPASDNYTAGKWMFPAHPTADIGRESQANLAENRQGLKSAADIYGEQGKDWEEEQEQLAIEAENIIRLAKDKNVPVSMIQMLTPNGNDAQLVDGDQSKPPLIDKIGIGGTQALADIISQVGQGLITPEAAIGVLKVVFGLTDEEAASMLPEPGSIAVQPPKP